MPVRPKPKLKPKTSEAAPKRSREPDVEEPDEAEVEVEAPKLPKIVKLSAGPKMLAALQSRGLPRDLLRQQAFSVELHTLSIASDLEGYRTRRVKKALQLSNWAQLLATPLAGNYVMVIASNPNDAKAKLAAAMLMEKATLEWSRRRPTQEAPMWHSVYGNYYDSLRDAEKQKVDKPVPSMLIISNVTTDSTAAKMELVRDLITMYDTVPRVLVVSGADPITFANRHLRLNITFCLNLSTAHRVQL